MECISHYKSPLGDMTLSSDGKTLTGLWFDFQKYDRATLERNYHEEELAVFDETKEWLRQYFRGENPSFFPKLKPKVTGFRKEVLEALLEIPYGKTKTYGEIAKQIARKRGVESISPQAVGNAIAHNPILLLIPCHRVIGKDGSLTGYAGGVERKMALLELESGLKN